MSIPKQCIEDSVAKKYYTIAEVADICHVARSAIRHWESEFPNARPIKRDGKNNRRYTIHEVNYLLKIRFLMVKQQVSTRRARQILTAENNLLHLIQTRKEEQL